MKEETPAVSGDISPITGSISNLAEEPKVPAKVTRKSEPSSEMLPNFSRVTPAQLAYISFPAEGRYQPVRPVSNRPVAKAPKGGKVSNLAPQRSAGGGGILMLVDLRPDEEGEFLDLSPPPPIVDAAANGTAVAGAPAPAAGPSGPHIALDESAPEADTPEPFEVYLRTL